MFTRSVSQEEFQRCAGKLVQFTGKKKYCTKTCKGLLQSPLN